VAGIAVGVALLAVVWACWGLSYPIMDIALRYIDVWSSRVVVMSLAGVALLGGSALAGRSLAVPRDLWRDLLIAAVFNMSIFQIGMTYGVLLLSPGRTALLVYTMPIWTAILATVLLGERIVPRYVVALGLGIAGILVLMTQDLSQLADAPLGAALTLMAAVSFAIGTILMKRRTWRVDLTVIAGWQLLVGVVPLTLIWLALGARSEWIAMPLEGWLTVAYLGLVANALAYVAWFRVIARFPATVSGLGTLAVPAVGLLTSALIVGERIGWREATSLALIGAALVTVLLWPTIARRLRGAATP